MVRSSGDAAGDRAQRCSALSRALAEPLSASAAEARGWVLLEHPGPWPEDAAARALPRLASRVRALAPRIRLLLIRRPERPRVERPWCFVGGMAADGAWLEGRRIGGPEALDGLDLGQLAAGRRPGFGPAVAGPLYAVCTNGRVDACCALQGRPVVQALAEEAPDQVWECTHLGGDRFAANLLVLPEALLFGRLDAAAARAVTHEYRAGRIRLPHYRGRAYLAPAAQAAEDAVRRELGLTAIDALDVGTPRLWDDGRAVVPVRTAAAHALVTVRQVTHPRPRPLTCGGPEKPSPLWELVELHVGEPAA